MNTRVSYAAVGLFVILFAVLLVGVGLWLSTDTTDREYQRYTIYSEESVTGLSRNATVRFQGVTVGRVQAIDLMPDQPGKVRITADIAVNAPVREDTVAQLSSQGLTGIAHLELRGGSADRGPPRRPEGEPYPVLTMTPSLVSRVESALSESMQTLDVLSDRLTRLLDDDNIDNLGATLVHLEQLTGTLARNSEQLDGMVRHGEEIMANSAEISRELMPMLSRMRESMDNVDEMTASVTHASRRLGAAGEQIGQATQDGSRSLQTLTSTTLPQLSELMVELQGVAASMNRLTDEIGERPNLLIFGRPERPPGPGEN
ncbi:MAG: MCE family protein [Ectothiorhodospiraceae bacterium]|nr:MCE family protein [Ectothiorhodospiraceae bacterium]MCH8506977.1 MCE family protein [Ectothiorhodospiraceae bacterium]